MKTISIQSQQVKLVFESSGLECVVDVGRAGQYMAALNAEVVAEELGPRESETYFARFAEWLETMCGAEDSDKFVTIGEAEMAEAALSEAYKEHLKKTVDSRTSPSSTGSTPSS